MANFPFFRPFYPSNYYRYYPSYRSSSFPKAENISEDTYQEADSSNTRTKKISSKHNSFGPIQFANPFSCDLEEPIFEILGIKLYLDDIIILSLLFFLYQENVQDELLFLSLILLLLS